MATPDGGIQDRIKAVLAQNGEPMTAKEIAKQLRCTPKEVNQKIYHMKEVSKLEGQPPKWKLCDAVSTTPRPNRSQSDVSPSGGNRTLDTDDVPLKSLSLEALPTTPTKQLDDKELEDRVMDVLESQTKAISAPDIRRVLADKGTQVGTANIKRVLGELERKGKVRNTSDKGAKPLWIIATSDQATINGEGLYTKVERKDGILFKKVSKDEVTRPPELTPDLLHQTTPIDDSASSISIPDDAEFTSLHEIEIPSNDDDDDVRQKPQAQTSPSLRSRSGKPQLAINFPPQAPNQPSEDTEPSEDKLQEEIVQKLSKYPSYSFSPRDVADMIGCQTRDVVRYNLMKLVERGLVENVGGDKYKIVN